MARSPWVGAAMILVAALLGAVLALGLLQWETQTRAGTVQFLPSPTPRPAQPTPSATVGASSSPTQRTPAASSPGATVFAAKCNACHPDGRAGAGPALRGPEFAAKYPQDAELKQIIRSGRGAMPAYTSAALSDADLTALVAYVRGLP